MIEIDNDEFRYLRTPLCYQIDTKTTFVLFSITNGMKSKFFVIQSKAQAINNLEGAKAE